MLPGVYTMPLTLATPNSLDVVATGAILSPFLPAIAISNGATVTVRGLTIVHAKAATCGGSSGPVSSLLLRDASITAMGNDSNLFDVSRCKLQVSASELSLAAKELAFGLGDDAVLHLERVHLHGNSSHYISVTGSRVTVDVTNSLLVDIGFNVQPADTGPPGSRLTVVSSTIIYRSYFALGQGCDVTEPSFVARYENSILAPLEAFDAVRGTNCTFSNTLLSFQATPPPGTFVADPHFVDAAARDFHLKATSPAVDMAVPSIFGLDSTTDLDGTPRPQGAKRDIGAYEYKP